MTREPEQLDLLEWKAPAPSKGEKVTFPPNVTDLLPHILLAAWKKRGTGIPKHEARILALPQRPAPDTPTRRIA